MTFLGDVVPKEETAIKIASSILEGIGYDLWQGCRGLLSQCEIKVQDEGDSWVVAWLLLDKYVLGGGTPCFRIAKKDGQVREFHFMR